MSDDAPNAVPRSAVEIVKQWEEVTLDADWDGVSTTVTLLGKKPIVGLAIKLSTGATLTFEAVVDGDDYVVLNTSGAVLSIDGNTELLIYKFFTEFAGIKELKITADNSQTDAKVIGLFAS